MESQQSSENTKKKTNGNSRKAPGMKISLDVFNSDRCYRKRGYWIWRQISRKEPNWIRKCGKTFLKNKEKFSGL